jgi:hypothetical protein
MFGRIDSDKAVYEIGTCTMSLLAFEILPEVVFILLDGLQRKL